MTHYTISITSDTVCPWCYIGHKRLTSAITTHLAKHPTDTFTTRWKPYQLMPEMPRGKSYDKKQFFAEKFGGEANRSAMMERMGAMGKSVGIDYKFGGRTGNTWDSHRVIAFARQREAEGDKGTGQTNLQGVQTRVVEELFADYFERERDITSHEVLAEAGVRAGLPREEVQRVLEKDEFAEVVDREVKEARMERITGVPHFVFQDRFEISGGQEPAAFLQIFERVKMLEGKEDGRM